MQGLVLWLTGLPGSGKTVLAEMVSKHLTEKGYRVERLDGDALRSQFPNTGFTREERFRHVERTGMLAARLEKSGAIVIVSLISPYADSRKTVRLMCGRFVEVYLKASVEECERRDPKGLYKKARRGEIKNFTGIDDPYEVPEHPEVVIDTEHQTVDQSFRQLNEYVDRLLV